MNIELCLNACDFSGRVLGLEVEAHAHRSPNTDGNTRACCVIEVGGK